MAQDFLATITAFNNKTKERMKAVRDESIRRTIQQAQLPVSEGGNMPVDTGFLRASGRATTNASIPLEEKPTSGPVRSIWDENSTLLTIKSTNLDTAITFAWAANYAVFANYGTSRMQGRQFAGLAAQQWPQIVAQVSKEQDLK